MDRLKQKLNELKENKSIESWSIENLDINGNVGTSEFRNTEKLTIYFPSGDTLEIGTFCSGSSENTVLV